MTAARRWPGYHEAKPSDSLGNQLHGASKGTIARPDLDEIADALLRYGSGGNGPPGGKIVTFADPNLAPGGGRRAGAGEAASSDAIVRLPIAQRPVPDPRRPAPPAMRFGATVQKVLKGRGAAADESARSGDDPFAADTSPARRTPGPYRREASMRDHPEQNRLPPGDFRKKRPMSRVPPAAHPEPKIGAPTPFLQAAVRDEDEMRRQRLAVYFGKRPLWTTFCLVAGVTLIFNPSQYHSIYGFELTLDRAFFVGLAILLIGLFFRYMRVQRPTDVEVDEWTIDDMKGAESRALELVDLDGREAISEPVILTGFPDIERISGTYWNCRYGKDNILRYTPRAMTVLRFTKDVAVTYECGADLVTGHLVYERTSEFFYRDIASVGLQKSAAPRGFGFFIRLRNRLAPWQWTIVDPLNRILSGRSIDTGVQRNMREVFQIKLINGETINVILRDGRLAGRRIDDEISVTSDDLIIRAVRDFVAKMKNEQLYGRTGGRTKAEI